MDSKTNLYVAYELVRNESAFVSGEEIAKSLSISRAAVKKAVDQLQKQGFKIESKTGLGYRLIALPELPVEPAVFALLKKRSFENIYYRFYQTVDSTQNEALRFYTRNRYQLDENEFLVFAALKQEKGIGRFRRSWFSHEGGIWVTILSKSDLPAKDIPLFPIAVALKIIEALELFGVKPELKWPNDIILKGKKVAGILATARTEIDVATHIFTGIGINVNNKIPAEIRDTAVSLKEVLKKNVNLLEVMVEVLSRVFEVYSGFDAHEVINKANKILYKKGKEALISLPNGEKIKGVIKKIGPNGELIADVEGKHKSFYASEIDNP